MPTKKKPIVQAKPKAKTVKKPVKAKSATVTKPVTTKAKAKAASKVKVATKAAPKKAVKSPAKTKPIAIVKSSAAKATAKPKTKVTTPTAKRKTVATDKASPKKSVTAKPTPVVASAKASTKTASTGPIGFTPYQEKKGEEYMNDEQIGHFHKILNLWKEQLYVDRDFTVQHMQDDAMNFPDPLDRASLEEEYTLELRARDRERKFIKKIDEALESIEHGDYGYCEDCGAEIGIRRLEARPTATQCIDCKTIDEIREKQTGVV